MTKSSKSIRGVTKTMHKNARRGVQRWIAWRYFYDPPCLVNFNFRLRTNETSLRPELKAVNTTCGAY
eukprot:CAMPEP_0169391776 /NCGR_PEP_ID=MMETSP1017-20121227/48268_1 /TAXON_ID=342587 /ORGANISM="Karlodinium micrum, Strain CCMP2283" /LENGTH=66 /DNA_ID=CAMNT_0009494677 /DNA_START=503 /DNA_END=700 /DNA_ORIENTATION=+